MAAFVPTIVQGHLPAAAPVSVAPRLAAAAQGPASRSYLGSAECTLLCAGAATLASVADRRRRRAPGAPRVVRANAAAPKEVAKGSTADLQAKSEEYLVNNYGKRSLAMVRGEGQYLFDADGKKYLDFGSGIAVNCLGHGDEGWVKVAQKHAATLIHTSNLYLNPEQVALGEKLVKLTFADKAFFCNSGTEANEAAIKFSRKFHHDQGKPREKFIAFGNAFHGRTMGALALTYKENYKAPFQPVMPSVEFLPYNEVEPLSGITEDVCAVFVEPMQGEGGVIPANAEFMQAVRKRCDEVGAVLVFDEVQCGLGRTGRLWGHEITGVTPDIMTLAKPLAGGLPIGAVVMTQKIADIINPGDHGSTFAGAPFVCALGNYTVDKVSQPAFIANVKEMGERFRAGLEKIYGPRGYTVRGEGLLNGVVFPEAAACGAVFKTCQDMGLLVLTAGKGNVLRLAPALNVSAVEVDKALEILEAATLEVEKKQAEEK